MEIESCGVGSEVELSGDDKMLGVCDGRSDGLTLLQLHGRESASKAKEVKKTRLGCGQYVGFTD